MYLIGILAAFISPATHSLSNIFDAYIVGNLFKKVATSIFFSNITNIFGLLILLATGQVYLPAQQTLLFAALAGIIGVAYLFPYYAALRETDTSVVAALFSLERVFIPVWAYLFIGEVVEPIQYAGLGIIIVTTVILNLQDPKKIKLNKAFWLMLLSAVILSFQGVLYKKVLQDTNWTSAAFWCFFIAFVVRLAMILFKTMRQDIVADFPRYKANFGKFCLISVTDQLGTLAPIYALSIIPVLVETSISATQPIFVVIYGFILAKLFGDRFKENLNRKDIIRKLICFTIIGIGVVLAVGGI